MSAPPSIRQITREALGEVPSWLDRLMQPLNTFIRQVQDLFSGNLTVAENLAQAWVELSVTEGQPVAPFEAKLRGRVAKGVSVERIATLGTGGTPGVAPTSSVTLLWEPTTVNGRPGVSVSKVFGIATGGRYTLTLLVKAE